MYSQPVLLIRIRISYGRLDPDPALDFRIQLLKKFMSKDAIYCDQWSFQRKMILLGSFYIRLELMLARRFQVGFLMKFFYCTFRLSLTSPMK
jgi:hypothetical protein